MFAFRSTLKLDDDTRIHLENRISNLLHAQLAILSDPVIQDISGDLNRKAIGYVYGFAKGYFSAGCELEDFCICVQVTAQVLEHLFGRFKKEMYARFLEDNLTDPIVLSGILTGDREVQDYLNNSNAMPVGLARFILEGEKLMAEA